MSKQTLEQRVITAAEKTLQEQHFVSAIDIFLRIGYLSPSVLKDWRHNKIPYLEGGLQVSLDKLSSAMKCFRTWALSKGLKASETVYSAYTSGPQKTLRFSKSGNADIELAYRTHYISPTLSEKKQQQMQEKMDRPPEKVVFCVTSSDAQCKQCNQELPKGKFLFLEAGQPLCLDCAGLDKLVYLPAGDTNLTRRAKKYSTDYAVVVRFSRARKRYERQGLLVQKQALHKAQMEMKVT